MAGHDDGGQRGVSLLDLYAGLAMMGACADPNFMPPIFEEPSGDWPKDTAKWAWAVAEAMIAEKRKREAKR